jgi:multimeric flavodoxin WrbA
LGAEVQTFVLRNLDYKGCVACMGCKSKAEKCVLDDDLGEVLEAVAGADVLVLATPTYYGEVTSQMKAFIDRTFSYLVPDYITNAKPSRLGSGKKLVFIQTQASKEEADFADVYPRYKGFFRWYGFGDAHLIRACGVSEAGAVAGQEQTMAQAEEVARAVMQ